VSALLELEGVTAGYIADIDILRGVTLAAEGSAVTGLIGLNGAGKSTVLKTIAGFLKPKAGAIRFAGRDITGIAPHALIAAGIGFIPQESSLFPQMSVEDNLRLPIEHLGRIRGGIPRGEISARFEDMYAQFPLMAERRRAQAGDLSGGQQKTLEFAKAYLQRPRLCLIDEPSIGLSPKIAEEVYGWIELFAARAMAVLLVDHNVRRVIGLSRRIYVLNLGEVSAEGSAADFAGDLHEQVRAWLGINF
jgi:branched-chain amino acid transport system ATP-binding protein